MCAQRIRLINVCENRKPVAQKIQLPWQLGHHNSPRGHFWTILGAEQALPAIPRWFWRQAGALGTRGRTGARGQAILAAMVLLPAAVRGSGGLSILGARRRGGHGPPTALGPLGSALADGPVFGAGGRASSGAGSISFFWEAC